MKTWQTKEKAFTNCRTKSLSTNPKLNLPEKKAYYWQIIGDGLEV